jgi:Family of unknown function (DUF6325)
LSGLGTIVMARDGLEKAMSIGPVELLIVKFPGDKLGGGQLAPALQELVENHIIRVIDLVIVRKDAIGRVATIELSTLDDADWAMFEPIVDEILGIISHDDIDSLSAMLDNDTSGAIMLFENTWATRFRDGLLATKGEVVFLERVPRSVIEEVMAAATATAAVA